MLQYEPLSSTVDIRFWYLLAKKKLEEFKLDDSIREVAGYYPLGKRSGTLALPSRFCLDVDAFDKHLYGNMTI